MKAILFAVLCLSISANAQTSTDSASPTPAPAATTPRPAGGAQKVDLNKIQQKYSINAGNEVQVIQNRTYTKAHKFELGGMFGTVSADPFLNIYSYGGFLGYHFSEYFGVRAFYWKDSAKHTPSWEKSVNQNGAFINTNSPESMMGGEVKFTPFYGKLSVFGSNIVYFDLSGFAGAGIRKTQSGSSLAPIFGVGQQFYFAKSFSLGLDYRIMKYSEKIIEQQPNLSTTGSVVETRSDFSSVFFFSLSWLIGF